MVENAAWSRAAKALASSRWRRPYALHTATRCGIFYGGVRRARLGTLARGCIHRPEQQVRLPRVRNGLFGAF